MVFMDDIKKSVIFFCNQPYRFQSLPFSVMLGGEEFPALYGQRFFIWICDMQGDDVFRRLSRG